MQSNMRVLLMMSLVAAGLLSLMGCDGEGLQIVHNPTSGDQTPDQDGGTPNPPPTPGQTDTRFAGTWVASFGDDFATNLSARGGMEYSARLQLTQQNTVVSGSGTLYRFLRQGAEAWERQDFTVTGTASASDATVTVRPGQGGTFDVPPVWYLRLAGNRLIGIFQETNSTGDLIRAGHAHWFRSSSGGVDGAWMAAVQDRYAATGFSREDRTATVTLGVAADNTLTGEGSFDVQSNVGSVPMDFDVTRGIFSTPEVDFTFGGLDLVGSDMNWLGFLGGNVLVSAYGQFPGGGLARMGHAVWYRGSEPAPSAINREWIIAFEDSATATSAPGNDYLARVTLEAQAGGPVTGSGTVRIVGDTEESFPVTVVNGNLLGSRLHLELQGGNRTFIWDLRTAGTLLVGSYRQLGAGGGFASRGTGEWRIGGNLNLVGSWVTSYYDTYGAQGPENTQMALMTISRADSGIVTGTGWLRYAGETRRRLFNMEGETANNEAVLFWQPQDLFGPTAWRIRQAGNFLLGTYVNEDSGGNLEARGQALWFRTNRTDTITQ